jgi:hypothetical protein
MLLITGGVDKRNERINPKGNMSLDSHHHLHLLENKKGGLSVTLDYKSHSISSNKWMEKKAL